MRSLSWRASSLALLILGLVLSSTAPDARAQTALRIVPHSDVKILDPIWTTAYITRNHGYLIYDTLFSMDAKGEYQPQMVEKFEVSADKKTYTFTLRAGLAWHDGAPVTAEDCIASIKRWGVRDSVGQRLMTFIEGYEAKAPNVFVIRLKEPTGLLISGLGKPSSNVPFMMPKRIADTDPHTQISDFTGSGPFIFKKDEWKPGDRIVYVKNAKYVPRSEAPSALAGAKIAKVDRIEWRPFSDHQQAVNALLAGEVDLIESPPHDLIPLLKGDKGVQLTRWNTVGNQYVIRPNWLAKPFDNPKVRQALWYALNQEDFLKAVIGDPAYYKVCPAMFICGTSNETNKGMDGLLQSNFKKSRELLAEAGYDGTPIVLLHSTDLQVLTNLAPVAKSLMEKGGFKVDMQSMDWQTVVSRRTKKDAPDKGGWHAFLTSWVAADVLNPVMAGFFNSSCERAMFGWPCDAEMEKLRDQYARESDPARLKQIAEAVQVRATQMTSHVNLGQWYSDGAHRKNITGWVPAPAPVFWNIEKK